MVAELIETLLQAHRSGDLEKLEECWLEMVDAVPSDMQSLLAILDELREWGESDRALAMLEVITPNLRENRRWSDLLEVLRRISVLKPESDNLGPDFAACYKHLNEDCETIDLFIEKSRLRFARPIAPALEAMEMFLALRKGDVVLHESGWGLGIVQGFDPLDAMLIVDFDDKKGHKINPTSAGKLLKKLEPGDFRALTVLDPEALVDMTKEDPLKLLRLVLTARARKVTPSKIKADLVPIVIPAKSWSSWWTRVRRLAENDPMIRCVGSGATATFFLRSAPADPVQEALQTFRSTGSAQTRSQAALDALRSHQADKIIPALIEAIQSLPAVDPATLAESHFLLEALGVKDPDRLDEATFADPDQAIQVLTGIEHPHLRKLAFEQIRKAPIQDRGRFLFDAFFKVTPDLWGPVYEDLEALGESGEVVKSEILSALILHPRTYPDRFGWLVNRALKGEIQSDQLPDPLSLLRKLMDAINHLYRHSSGKKEYRRRLGRMTSSLTDRDGKLLDEILDRCTAEDALGLRERFFSCPAFTENTKRELGVRIARRHNLQPLGASPGAEPEATETPVSSDVLWATRWGYEARKAVYDKLVNEDIPRGQGALNEAASHGDLSENAELDYAREQQGFMTQRAETMESEFRRSRIIESHTVPRDKVGIGSRGKFQNRETGEVLLYTILGPWETDPDNGILSYDSPLASQLMDHTVGETFEVNLPGRRLELTLLEVDNGLEAARPDANAPDSTLSDATPGSDHG